MQIIIRHTCLYNATDFNLPEIMQIIVRHTCPLHLSNCPTTMSDSAEGNKLQHTDCRNFPCYIN